MNYSVTQLRERVLIAAEKVLKRNGSVGPLELVQELDFLQWRYFEDWRKGLKLDSPIESRIQCGTEKLADTYRLLAEWVTEKD